MKAEIQKLYEGLKLMIPCAERIAQAFAEQDYYAANTELLGKLPAMENIFGGVLSAGDYFSGTGIDAGKDNILFLLGALLKPLEQKEYILTADVLRQSVLPFFYSVQEHIVGTELSGAETFDRGGRSYAVEYTSSGQPTLRAGEGGTEFYLHSNLCAETEGEQLARSWYRPEQEHYIVYGMGLGYAVQALLRRSEYIFVEVYESDAFVLELAGKYGVLGELKGSGQVTAEADEDGTRFAAAVKRSPDAQVCFFYPSIRLIRGQKLRERMEDAFVSQASQRGQSGALYGNFRRNIAAYDALADELRPEFKEKRVFMVAAGPSLDKNIRMLKEAKGHGLIVAVGTVLKKLLKAGIRPDYFVVTDAKAPTFVQADGVDAQIPMLGLSTAYYRFFTDYRGKHYLLCQEGFAPAEQFAKEKGCGLIRTGGSVITAALDAVLCLGAAEVIFVGLDLAFTGGRDHASDTAFAAKTEGAYRMVPDLDGNPVPTARNLDIYRQFIERVIAGTDGVRFVDATEGGARVAGTEIMRLSDYIREIQSRAAVPAKAPGEAAVHRETRCGDAALREDKTEVCGRKPEAEQ